MGTCQCMDKSKEESAVILEETFKKHQETPTFSGIYELSSIKCQGLCRGYLVRRIFKSENIQNSQESNYTNFLTIEARYIYNNVLKLNSLTHSSREAHRVLGC